MDSPYPIEAWISLVQGTVPPRSRRIHPDDQMFLGDRAHYFQMGRDGLQNIGLALIAAKQAPERIRRVLDFASGYGRVIRYVREAFPDASLVASDVMSPAVEFCAAEFGAVPVVSSPDLGEVQLGGSFDLIWCGSLLTHVDAPRWRQVLDLLVRHLAPEGVLLFTTIGRMGEVMISRGETYGLPESAVQGLARSFRKRGFGYVDYPHRQDYGLTLASRSWTLRLLEEHYPMLLTIGYREAAWDHQQDIVACQSYSHFEDPTILARIDAHIAGARSSRGPTEGSE